MEKIKIGINGFGRIGRLVFRATTERDDVQVVAINDLLDVDYMAYMLRYDTTHGKFNGTVEVKDGMLVVNGNKIRVTAEKEPANLKWDEAGAILAGLIILILIIEYISTKIRVKLTRG